MKVSYYGHSCFGVEINGRHLLFDPFISENPLASDIDVDRIPADYILVSHGHYDHIADVKRIAKRTGATVISNFEITTWLEKEGVEKVHPMNIGGQWAFDFGKVKYVNAVHSSALPDGSNGGNPGGFVIDTPQCAFYHAGDTALSMDMQLIGRQCDLCLAFLPIGDNFTMGIDDAVQASSFLKCNHVIPMHYDTFELIRVDHDEAVRKFRNAEVELKFMEIGETREM